MTTDRSIRISRVVVRGRPSAAPEARMDLFFRALEAAAPNGPADVLVLPAGLLEVVEHGLATGRDDGGGAAIVLAGEMIADRLGPRVQRLAARAARFLVVGVDVVLVGDDADGARAEAAIVVDTAKGKVVAATGTSFPARGAAIVDVADVSGHVARVGGRRLAILCGHDLVAFHPRSQATAQGARKLRSAALRRAIVDARPHAIVHLVDRTDAAGTWRGGWARLVDEVGGDVPRATAFSYFAGVGRPRDALGDVLAATARGAADVVVGARPPS